MPPRSRWTDDRDSELRSLWFADVALGDIADRLGYADPRSIAERARQLDLPERPALDGRARGWTEDRLADLRRLWAEGLSCSQIGKALGVTRNSVIGKVHRLGLPGRAAENDGRGRAARIAAKAEAAEGRPISAYAARRHGPRRGSKSKANVAELNIAAPGFATLRAGASLAPDLDWIEPIEPPAETACLLADRPAGACCFPLWGGGRPPLSAMLYCGAPTTRTYCAAHRARMYTPHDTRQPRPAREAAR